METLVIWHFILPNEQLRAQFEKAVVISPSRAKHVSLTEPEASVKGLRSRLDEDPPEGSSVAPSSGLKLWTSSEFPTISLNATKDNDNENPSYWGMGGEAGSLLSKSNIWY